MSGALIYPVRSPSPVTSASCAGRTNERRLDDWPPKTSYKRSSIELLEGMFNVERPSIVQRKETFGCNCMSNNDLNDSSVLGRRPALESKPDGRVLEQLFNGHHCSVCHSNWFDGLSSSSIHTDAASLLPIRFRRNGQLRNSTNACKCFTTESERMYFIEVFRLAQFRSCMARKSELGDRFRESQCRCLRYG